MAFGGPVSYRISPFAQARENRARLSEALRIQKEIRENNEAIARERLKMVHAQAQHQQAQEELNLIQQREAQIQASPGKPYSRGAATQGQIFTAQEKIDDAIGRVQEHKDEMQRLIESRDDRIRRGSIKTPGGLFSSETETPFSKLPGADPAKGGAPFQQDPLNPFGDNPYKTAVRKAELGDPNLGQEEKAFHAEQREINRANLARQNEQARMHGLEEQERIGEGAQAGINEDERNKQLYPLEERAAAQRERGSTAQAGVEAAAQEMAARQREQQFVQSQGQGGGGYSHSGGSGILGLLGAIATKAGNSMGQHQDGGGAAPSSGKGGGSGAPMPPQRPTAAMPPQRPPFIGAPQPPQRPGTPMPPTRMATPTPPIRPPTVGQIAVPILGKVAQMPAHHLGAAVKQILGGGQSPMPPQRPQMQPTYGARIPPVRPQFGEQNPGLPPRRPVMEPGAKPSVAMEGQGGGGTPQISGLEGGLFNQLVKSYQGQGWSPQQANNIASVQTRGEGGGLGTGGVDASSGGGNGISQWSADRWSKGVNWMKSKGLNPRSVEGQTAWTTQELRGPYSHVNPDSVASLVNDYESPRKDLRAGEIARSQRASGGGGGSTKTGTYKGQEYTYAVPGGSQSSEGYGRQQSQQQPQQQQAQQPQQQQTPQQPKPTQQPFTPQQPQMSQGPQRPNISPPMVQNPGDELKMGLKPGSIFRTPDGRLKIVPIPAQAQPEQAGM